MKVCNICIDRNSYCPVVLKLAMNRERNTKLGFASGLRYLESVEAKIANSFLTRNITNP